MFTRTLPSNSRQVSSPRGHCASDHSLKKLNVKSSDKPDNKQQLDSATSIEVAPLQQHCITAPLYHLKGKEIIQYEEVKSLDFTNLFEVALELFNRRSVVSVPRKHPKTLFYNTNTASEEGKAHGDTSINLCRYFFQCAGKMKCTMQLCTYCHDLGKDVNRYDHYYIDLVEISHQRAIRCWTCMYMLLKKNVRGSEEDLRKELKELREKQQHGIRVDPFTFSCMQSEIDMDSKNTDV